MQTSTISASMSVGGINFTSRVSRQAEGQVSHIVDLLAGETGKISAGGVDNMDTGHIIEAADVVDIHWDDPTDGTHKCRRGLLVDTAEANLITFDEVPPGEGDALPAVGTVCVVNEQVEINTDFTGNDVELVAVMCTKRGMADFRTSVPAEIVAVKLVAGEGWDWASEQNIVNPLADAVVDKIIVSNGETAEARVYVGVLYQSV